MQIIKAIRTAAIARFDRNPPPGSSGRETTPGIESAEPVRAARLIHTTQKFIALGASTGGTRAIEMVLMEMPQNAPGIVMVQHMPPVFTTSFANRLNQICAIEVREAKDRDKIEQGLALLAPGNFHMLVEKSGASYYVRIKEGPQVHFQRPSVDVMFKSVAESAGLNALGVLLTGMGTDGAKGLLAMKEKGSYTIAQDEATSVVFGMPKEAINLGAVTEVCPLNMVATSILKNYDKA